MRQAHILIIEDDLTLNHQLAGLLRGQGFSINQCHDGQEGLLTALSHSFDLILLDVLLPKTNGFSVLKQLRQVRQTPVMMITACGAESERIEGYSKGADDYLPKPFSFAEAKVRIDALLRRAGWGKRIESQKNILSSGNLHLLGREQQARYTDVQLKLTPIEFRLLWALVESEGETLSKPYLYQAVLERAFSRYDRTVDMHLSRVRKKLTDAGMSAQRLSTIHGKGYRFV